MTSVEMTDSADRDSLHRLPLSLLPIQQPSLSRARIVKDNNLRSMVEMFNGGKSGNGLMQVADLANIFDDTDEFNADLEILEHVEQLHSYDVYSLRIQLRRLGIPLADNKSLQLSEPKARELADNMREFTRPLMQQIYGSSNEGIIDMNRLLKMFNSPDKGEAMKQLRMIAAKLGIPLREVPVFMEEYGDVTQSVTTQAVASTATGVDADAETVIGRVRNSSDVEQTIVVGTVATIATGVGATTITQIGDIEDGSNINENVAIGAVVNSNLAADSEATVQVGNVSSGVHGGATIDIAIGAINNSVVGAKGATSQILVGNIFKQDSGRSDIKIATGLLSSNVAAALDATSGILIGNVKASKGHDVNVIVGGVVATADACVGAVCLSELVIGDNCVAIGNVGIGCNNEAKQLAALLELIKELVGDAEAASKAALTELEKIAGIETDDGGDLLQSYFAELDDDRLLDLTSGAGRLVTDAVGELKKRALDGDKGAIDKLTAAARAGVGGAITALGDIADMKPSDTTGAVIKSAFKELTKMASEDKLDDTTQKAAFKQITKLSTTPRADADGSLVTAAIQEVLLFSTSHGSPLNEDALKTSKKLMQTGVINPVSQFKPMGIGSDDDCSGAIGGCIESRDDEIEDAMDALRSAGPAMLRNIVEAGNGSGELFASSGLGALGSLFQGAKSGLGGALSNVGKSSGAFAHHKAKKSSGGNGHSCPPSPLPC